METQALLNRLNDIGHSLERSGHALALMGLGSVGLELDRLDAYSDLDFFAIVEEGYKNTYLDSIHWLSDVHPIAYSFLNTEDGYKVLFEDGIFCEFAVFEAAELEKIPFAAGRIVWKRAEVPEQFGQPTAPLFSTQKRAKGWLLGEALTNLYVGLNLQNAARNYLRRDLSRAMPSTECWNWWNTSNQQMKPIATHLLTNGASSSAFRIYFPNSAGGCKAMKRIASPRWPA